jgi:hypothetical protein
MIRNSRILDGAFLRNITREGETPVWVVDPILDAIVVVLESCFKVENIALERLEVVAFEIEYPADASNAVGFPTEANTALKQMSEYSDSIKE